MELVRNAYNFCSLHLKSGGVFLVKVLMGEELKPFQDVMKNNFEFIKVVKPEASRKESAEVYILGKGFKNKKIEEKKNSSQ